MPKKILKSPLHSQGLTSAYMDYTGNSFNHVDSDYKVHVHGTALALRQ